MSRNPVETVIGAGVLLLALAFSVLVYRAASLGGVDGYPLSAHFIKVGGLQEGSDVRVHGVKVGVVSELRLDTQTFEAVVVMSIDPTVRVPEDSVVGIGSDGVLGGKFVVLTPGDSPRLLAANALVSRTQDFQSLEDQVSQIIFLASGGT